MKIRYTIINDENKFENYFISGCLENLKSNSKISNYNIYNQTQNEYNIKIEDKDKNLYFIDLDLSMNEESEQLQVKVYSKSNKKEYDIILEEIKRDVKKYFLKNWKKSRCYWIEDYQVIQLSEKLYPRINMAENSLRTFINIVMESNYGASWWDKYIPYNIKDKYDSRKIYLKRNVSTFNDVVDNLLSIDVDDLVNILTLEVKKWSPKVSEGVEIAIKKNNQNKLLQLLKEQMEVSLDLWDELFKNYFDEKFLGYWKNFCADRNHIAHNKPIDYNAFKKINNNVDNIIEDIKVAKDKFKNYVSENKDNEIRAEVDIEYEDYIDDEYDEETLEHEIMEIEANIRILSEDEIFEKFKEIATEICDKIENNYYFRQDLYIDTHELTYESCILLTITSKINSELIQLKAIFCINDGSGETSQLEIQITEDNDIIYNDYIEYINGEAEYNFDQGYYMPIIEDQLIPLDLDELSEELNNKVEEVFPKLLEEAESINELRIKDGDARVTSEEVCEECYEEGVSIDDSFFEYGKCCNCGYENNVSECMRCNKLFIGEEEFCNNCKGYIDKE